MSFVAFIELIIEKKIAFLSFWIGLQSFCFLALMIFKTYKNTKIYYQVYKKIFNLNQMIEKNIFLMYDIYIKSNK